MAVLLQSEVNYLLEGTLDKMNSILGSKPSKVLYINLTSNNCSYNFDVTHDINAIDLRVINFYECIIINSDNIDKLLDFLSSEKKDLLLEFIQRDKLYVGMGYGAEILSDIAYYIDSNNIVNEYEGLNAVNSFNFFSSTLHKDSNDRLNLKKYYLDLSDLGETIVIKDEPIYIDKGTYTSVGNKCIEVIDYFNTVDVGLNNCCSLYDLNCIKDEFDLMDFMNKKLVYGWIDNDKKLHLNNLTDFKCNYKIMSNEIALETGLATCIEGANIINEYLNKIGYETKIIVDRIIDDKKQVFKMHVMVLYKKDNQWYYFEHSNKQKRGIKLVRSIEDFVNSHSYSENSDIRIIPDIPINISYKEFNDYIDTFKLENCFYKEKNRR